MLKKLCKTSFQKKLALYRSFYKAGPLALAHQRKRQSMFQRWGRKWLEADMHERAKAKETLHSPIKTHLTFLNLFCILGVPVHMTSFQQVA